MINDGIARNMDCKPERGLYRLMGWLRDVWRAHVEANQLECQYAQPGLRTVLAAGSRFSYTSDDMTLEELISARNPHFHGENLSSIYQKKFLNRTGFYIPFEFQMNLAFAKAYALEALGSRGGLTGTRFFLDNSVIELFLSKLNGTEYQFIVGNGSQSKPVRVQSVTGATYRAIQILTPDPNGVYHENGFIALDPEPISNESSTLWSLRQVMYPFPRHLVPDIPDSSLYSSPMSIIRP
jgi:hypothetical protein